jgi:AcrR family transcriptional regulator
MMKGRQKKSKARTPVQNRSIEKKSHIINTAYELFSKKNYEDVSIRLIAKKAGVSIGTIYSYFGDKREIFIEAGKLYTKYLYDNLLIAIKNDLSPADTIEDSIYKITRKLSELIKTHLTIHRDIYVHSMTDLGLQEGYIHNETATAESIVKLFIPRFKDKIKISYDSTSIFIMQKIIEDFVQFLLFFKVDIDEDRVFRELARMLAYYIENKK